MRVIYVFYADTFLLQNFLMDFAALCGANYFLKRRQKAGRLAKAAALYAVVSLLLLLVIHNYVLYLLFIHFAVNTSMVWLCFGWHGKREFLENWAVIYISVILFGGIAGWITDWGILPRNYAVITMLIVPAGYGILTYFMQRREFANQLFLVRLKKEERCKKLEAYWDSGNQLRDPYTGQAVSIISHSAAAEFVNRERDAIRYVPFRALGTEHGLMEVFTVEELCIFDGRKEHRITPAVIGIANPGLLEHKEYDMILHASLL